MEKLGQISLIFAIASIIPISGIITSLVAVILAYRQLKIKKTNHAVWGLIIGVVMFAVQMCIFIYGLAYLLGRYSSSAL